MWYEIFKFEIKYRIKRSETYIFFIVIFLFSIVAFNFLSQGQNFGAIKENAPYLISRTMAIVSGLFMIISSMIMGVPILRDFEYNIESLLFINPIKKRDYLLGRFLGAFVVLLFIFSGLFLGIILGDYMPWRDPSNLLPFTFWSYFKPFITIVIPTLFFGGSVFFVSGMLSRNLIVVYTQGIMFFVAFFISRTIENPFLSAILDPFSSIAIKNSVQSWSILEHNTLLLPIDGVLLYNRVFWILIGILALIIGYRKFNFNVVKDSPSKKKLKVVDTKNDVISKGIEMPNFTMESGFKSSWIQLKVHTIFYFTSILKQASFWSILIIGMVVIYINSVSLGTTYNVDSYPATYLIVEELQETSFFFFLIILVFYSGELIWKERGAKLDLIYDALPVSDFINLTSKFIGLLLTYSVLIFALILSGIAFQTFHGYYKYDLDVYFMGFFIGVFPFLVLYTFISFFIHVVCNSKFIGYVLVLLFFILTIALDVLGYNHGLLKFGSNMLGTYSDMNGYGHFLESYIWFKLYWIAFSVLLFVFAVIFMVRGKETAFTKRLKLIKQRLNKPMIALAGVAITVFILIGTYIFYNTNVLNTYRSQSDMMAFRADYEKNIKLHQNKKQPKLSSINLNLELYPKDRSYILEGYYILTNILNEPIQQVDIQKWFGPQVVLKDVHFEGGATVDSTHKKFDYYRYTLNQTLKPGDSIKMSFKQIFTTSGFREKQTKTAVLYNGTNLQHHHFPGLGYFDRYEIDDNRDRKEYGLTPITSDLNKLADFIVDENGEDGHEVHFEIIIGTALDQIAIAPGNLENHWTENNRAYFHYKTDKPMLNSYSIASARYETVKDTWASKTDTIHNNPVALEIYYHKGHEYNLDRMMESMKLSLDYYSTHFSPYQFKQLRINEFPRYGEFAQSFPNMIPFSEALGFSLNIDDKKDVDMAFYVTAHELAHQWWAHQIMAEDIQGWPMIIETLAQYSALMVLKKRYSEKKVQQFLKMQLDSYLEGRLTETKQELPLGLVEKQEYIYYRKGALNMFAFQDYIGEEKVNLALSQFIKEWNSTNGIKRKKEGRYSTTTDLFGYFRNVTPDSLQYVITDLFETVTLYDNKISSASYKKHSNNQYKIDLTIKANKYRVDSLGIETKAVSNDWVDVAIYGKNKEEEESVLIYLKKHNITNEDSRIKIVLNQKPLRVEIDPIHKLIDRNIDNNVIVLSEKDRSDL